jgi:hypothetical protein
MGNSIPGVATKILTFVPFAAALYFFDFAKFSVVFTPTLLAFFVASVILVVLGVILKAKVLRAALQLSDVSFAWGTLFLAFAVAAYLYGPYSPDLAWYRYESLCLLAISYVAFRIGTKVLRVMSPLLLILALSFAPLGLFPTAAKTWASMEIFWVYMVAFLVYTRLRLQSVLLPAVIVGIGLAMWLATNYLQYGLPSYLYVYLPAPLLVLLVPKVRAFTMLPGAKSAGKCPVHTIQADGFCTTCGARLSAPAVKENFGPWGLLAVAGVTAILLFASVPALAFVGGVPYDAQYTPQGYSSSLLPATPSGWQVNSTSVQKFPGVDLYAVVKVYVPLFHPETKNYTVYYEVAAGPLVSSAPSGGDIAGWTRASNDFMQYGPYQGYFTTYTTSGRVMLSYQGKTRMSFMNDGTFQEYNVGLGFVRVFDNSNVAADSSQFLGDMNSLWLPTVNNDVSYSTWTGFLSTTYNGAVFVTPFLFIVSSIGVMLWFLAEASRRDERLDRFLTLSSVQPQSSWSTLSLLLARKNHSGTPLELASGRRQGEPRDVRGIGASLESLEQRHLVRKLFAEAGSDVVLVWKAVV